MKKKLDIDLVPDYSGSEKQRLQQIINDSESEISIGLTVEKLNQRRDGTSNYVLVQDTEKVPYDLATLTDNDGDTTLIIA